MRSKKINYIKKSKTQQVKNISGNKKLSMKGGALNLDEDCTAESGYTIYDDDAGTSVNYDFTDSVFRIKCENDLYFAYYNSEFDINKNIGLERTALLKHRFDSWLVSRRR